MEVSGQLHAPAALPLEKGPPGTDWIRGWVEIRASCNISAEIGFEVFTALTVEIVTSYRFAGGYRNAHAADSYAGGARLESRWYIGYLE
jgi:hypothetical protein